MSFLTYSDNAFLKLSQHVFSISDSTTNKKKPRFACKKIDLQKFHLLLRLAILTFLLCQSIRASLLRPKRLLRLRIFYPWMTKLIILHIQKIVYCDAILCCFGAAFRLTIGL
jgi:hypothetical protein